MGNNNNIPHLEVGYNTLTNLLLTSWIIQVEDHLQTWRGCMGMIACDQRWGFFNFACFFVVGEFWPTLHWTTDSHVKPYHQNGGFAIAKSVFTRVYLRERANGRLTWNPLNIEKVKFIVPHHPWLLGFGAIWYSISRSSWLDTEDDMLQVPKLFSCHVLVFIYHVYQYVYLCEFYGKCR